ncbi:MAG: hypothetical protein GMKNLPBB_02833 [Myxococcota bacterium]|nr:hypothetical protein [Myxococcota bacterium]
MNHHSSILFRLVFPSFAIAALLAGFPAAANKAAGPSDAAGREVVLQAMTEELDRSMKQLKQDHFEDPYFILYSIRENRSTEIFSKYGSVIAESGGRSRELLANVRIGDYSFDNTVDKSGDFSFSFSPGYRALRYIPLDDNKQAIRNSIWLVTDEEYKGALKAWYEKKGKKVSQVEDKDFKASFSREKPQVYREEFRDLKVDTEKARALVRTLSGEFAGHPEIFDSMVQFSAVQNIRWLVNSEGTRLITSRTIFGLQVFAYTRADDGMLLDNTAAWYGETFEDLPSTGALQEGVRKVIRELLALRQAPLLDPYTGPAILLQEATGVLFHEAVGHRLEGERQNDDRDGRTFKGQIGKRVIPEFLSLADDPTQSSHGAVKLNGWYRYDEEGVPAQRVPLIENGVLKNYLMSRKPVGAMVQSNGHGRAQGNQNPVARMANLIIQAGAAHSVSMADLKAALIAEIKSQDKPYGLMIREISGGSTNTSTYGYQAFKGSPKMVYRVFPNGREELVRGVEMVGTPLTSINKIKLASRETQVFNGFCGAESGYVPVSTVAPAVLSTEIEVQRVSTEAEKPPVLPSPWTSGNSAKPPSSP